MMRLHLLLPFVDFLQRRKISPNCPPPCALRSQVYSGDMAKWAKGESGNPGGRPSGLGGIREFAREHTDTAIATLVRVMNDEDASPSAQVAAATALLDRGWGRPAQTINASIDAN